MPRPREAQDLLNVVARGGAPADRPEFNGLPKEAKNPLARSASMRLAALLLAALLPLAAGCTLPGAGEEPAPDDVAPAGDDLPPDEAPPAPEPGEEPAPPAPDEPPPATPAPGPEPEPEAPPAPEPRDWTVGAALTLGVVAGAGAGGTQGAPASVAQGDATHCPNGTFTVPAGATLLEVNVSGEHASAEGPGAGTFAVRLVSPSGRHVLLEPARDAATGTTENRLWRAEPPEVGEWRAFLEPLGPAANQAWTLTLAAHGRSVEAPALLAAAPACGA